MRPLHVDGVPLLLVHHQHVYTFYIFAIFIFSKQSEIRPNMENLDPIVIVIGRCKHPHEEILATLSTKDNFAHEVNIEKPGSPKFCLLY